MSRRRPSGPPEIGPIDWRAFRRSFTDREWRLFQSRLTSALKAIETLRAKAPQVFAVYMATSIAIGEHKSTKLSGESRFWIESLIERLLSIEETDTPPLDRRQLLQLIRGYGRKAEGKHR